MTPYAALLDRVRRDPSAPLVTYRDLATGERMELSAASFANAVAKTAGLLRDELDAQPGAIVGVHLPLHWQRVMWLGACAAAGTVFAADADPALCDVLVMDRARVALAGIAGEDVLVSLAPFGLTEPGGTPPGITDASVAMRGHPDSFTPHQPPSEGITWLREPAGDLPQGEAMARAAAELARRGVGAGQRFALIEPEAGVDLLALAGPLESGGSVVLVTQPDAGDVEATLREEGAQVARG